MGRIRLCQRPAISEILYLYRCTFGKSRNLLGNFTPGPHPVNCIHGRLALAAAARLEASISAAALCWTAMALAASHSRGLDCANRTAKAD